MTKRAKHDDTHVSAEEAAQANSAKVGGGTPYKAPEIDLAEDDPRGSWLPTRKWWAGLVGAATPIVLSVIDSGWDKVEEAMTVTAVSGLLLAYILRNDPAPGGVPQRFGG